MNKETKIGVVTFAVLCVLALLCAALHPFERFHSDSIHVQAIMTNAQGIRAGARVLYKGVDIGEIQETSVKDGKAVLILKLTKDVHVPKDADISIDTKGVVGDSYVKIDEGHDSSGYLGNGDVLIEHPSDKVDRLLQKADKLMKTAGDTANTIQQLKNQ